jgi:hypothetical protein
MPSSAPRDRGGEAGRAGRAARRRARGRAARPGAARRTRSRGERGQREPGRCAAPGGEGAGGGRWRACSAQLEVIPSRRASCEASLEAARADQRLAEDNLARTVVRAPVRGCRAGDERGDRRVGARGRPWSRASSISQRDRGPAPGPPERRRAVGVGDDGRPEHRQRGRLAQSWPGFGRADRAGVGRVEPERDGVRRGAAAPDADAATLLRPGQFVMGEVESAGWSMRWCCRGTRWTRTACSSRVPLSDGRPRPGSDGTRMVVVGRGLRGVALPQGSHPAVAPRDAVGGGRPVGARAGGPPRGRWCCVEPRDAARRVTCGYPPGGRGAEGGSDGAARRGAMSEARRETRRVRCQEPGRREPRDVHDHGAGVIFGLSAGAGVLPGDAAQPGGDQRAVPGRGARRGRGRADDQDRGRGRGHLGCRRGDLDGGRGRDIGHDRVRRRRGHRRGGQRGEARGGRAAGPARRGGPDRGDEDGAQPAGDLAVGVRRRGRVGAEGGGAGDPRRSAEPAGHGRHRAGGRADRRDLGRGAPRGAARVRDRGCRSSRTGSARRWSSCRAGACGARRRT